MDNKDESTLASQSQAAQPSIKTWRERLPEGAGISFDYAHVSAMKAEIAELRAYLAGQSQATRAVPEGWNVKRVNVSGTHRIVIESDKQMRSITSDGEPTLFRFFSDLLVAPTAQESQQIAVPGTQTRAWFRQASSFGPWIECGPDDDGATLFLGERDDSAAQEVTQQAAPTDDLLDVFDPARSKLKREDWDAATRKPKVGTQQAAKAETADVREFAAALESRCIATDRETDGEYCLHCDRRGYWDSTKDDVVLEHAPDCIVLRARAFLAPTTSTVSAPEEVRDAAPVISSYDLEKVKSLKYKFVDELIHSGIQYRTCGTISATLNQIIDDSEKVASAALRTTSGKGEAA